MGSIDAVGQLAAPANFAFAIAILALTLSTQIGSYRPSHTRSWLFFRLASVALILHAATELLGAGASELSSLAEVATTALLSVGFVLLYGADRQGQERVQQEAEEDPLTRLYNRRVFASLATARLERTLEHGGKCCIVLLDLDGFKQLNDAQGHQAGDQMLQLVAMAIRANLRPADLAARHGGDEFALLLDRCGAEEADRVVRRVMRSVVMMSTASGAQITVSGGIAVAPASGTDIRDLLHRADKMLLAVKRGGKDDVRVASAA